MSGNEVLLITVPTQPYNESYDRLKTLHPGLEIIHYNTKDVKTIPAEVWAKVTIHLTLYLLAPDRAKVPNLKWIHVFSAGINQTANSPLLQDSSIIWTRNSGVHGPQIAEWVMGTLMAYYRQIPTLLKWQESAEWNSNEYRPRGDLLGKTIAFLGYGAIARHAARIAAACGMRVVAYTLHPKTTPEERKSNTFTLQHTGDPDGEIPTEWHSGDLNTFLSSSHIDVVVVSLPSTEKTRQSIGKRQFELIKEAYLINIARGNIVNTPDLVEALNDGTLSGAALDVTDPEPLPKDHPLWKAKNVFISPHISGLADEYMPRTIEIIDANLTRLEKGEELMNLIRREDGY